MLPQTRFKILWQHDGARELEVVVDVDLPPFGPMEQRIRSIASIASSHRGLRLLLEGAFGDQWHVGVFEAVGGVTGVHLSPIGRT